MTDRPASWAHADPEADGEACRSGRQRARYSTSKRSARRDAPRILTIRTLRLAEIHQHILRVSCSRCGRAPEIQKADAVRLAGAQAVWKDEGQRLLDDTCQQRTGRHEEDGCWPSFE